MRSAQVGDEGSDVALWFVDLDTLDHGAHQPPAILGAERVPDPVEIGEAPRYPARLDLAGVK
jgi:hypothetical protein